MEFTVRMMNILCRIQGAPDGIFMGAQKEVGGLLSLRLIEHVPSRLYDHRYKATTRGKRLYRKWKKQKAVHH